MRIFAALVGVLFSFAVFAANTSSTSIVSKAPEVRANYLEGKDYTLLDEPVRPLDPNKIEVAEVFAYTCPHCFHFEPMIEAWMKTQKSDVVLVQTHTQWAAAMEPYQRGFYTAVVLKIKDKVQLPVFKAVHEERKVLGDAQAWADLFANYGVTKEAVLSTYDSFVVTGMIAQAETRVRGYKVSGTPELVVDGKYRISSRLEGGHQEMLKVAQFLVNKVRTERAAKQ